MVDPAAWARAVPTHAQHSSMAGAKPPGGHPVQGSDMAMVQAWVNDGLVTGASLFTAVFQQPQEPLSGLEFSGPGYKAALFVPR